MATRITLIAAICLTTLTHHNGAAVFFGAMYLLAAIKDLFTGIITIKTKPK